MSFTCKSISFYEFRSDDLLTEFERNALKNWFKSKEFTIDPIKGTNSYHIELDRVSGGFLTDHSCSAFHFASPMHDQLAVEFRLLFG